MQIVNNHVNNVYPNTGSVNNPASFFTNQDHDKNFKDGE